MDPRLATDTESRLAWEGFLPVWSIVGLGLLLLAVCFWLARRDGRLAGRPWAVAALALLRTAAILVVLWMLAGPTRVTVTRQTRPKSVAVFVDRSASMGLSDAPDGSGNVSQWSTATTASTAPADAQPLARADAALATIRVGLGQLDRWARLPDGNADPAVPRADLARAVDGMERGWKELRDLAQVIGARGDAASRWDAAVSETAEGSLRVLREKVAEFGRGKTLASLDRPRWLLGVQSGMTDAVGRIEALVLKAWKSAEVVPTGQNNGTATGTGAGRSRWEQVQTLLGHAEAGWLGTLRKSVNLTRFEFGERVVSLGSAPWSREGIAGTNTSRGLAPSTHLGDALQQAAMQRNVQSLDAAILITDGGQNAGRDPREAAAALAGTTLLIVPAGNTRMQRDVILHHVQAPKAAMRNDQVVVDAVVTAYDCDAERLRVELVDNGAVVDRKDVEVRGEVLDARVQLRWKAAEPGRRRLELRVVPVRDERTEGNNASVADVLVMEDRLRVLVADHYPRWETRYLLNLFKRDERITFDQLLFEPSRAGGKGVLGAFPSTLAEWSKYRIVILGDLQPTQLTRDQQNLLRRYVTEAGGNLILIAGRESMPGSFADQPLAGLLPVETGPKVRTTGVPYYLHLADEGSATIATQIGDTPDASVRLWREMSQRLPLYGLSDYARPKRTAHALLWAAPRPDTFSVADPATRAFLTWHYVGKGRVVYLAAPVSYQLRYREGDTFHHRFWGQLLRWSVARDLAEGSQTVRLGTDKSRYEQGDTIETTVRMAGLDGREVRGATVVVTAFQDGKAVQEVALREDVNRPGLYRGSFSGIDVGPVRFEARGDRIKALLAEEGYGRPVETTVAVDPSGELELRHPLCNLALLRETADAAGGVVVPPTGLAAAMAQLDLTPMVREEMSKRPLWNRWDLFWLFILCLSLEWAGRKWLGLA